MPPNTTYLKSIYSHALNQNRIDMQVSIVSSKEPGNTQSSGYGGLLLELHQRGRKGTRVNQGSICEKTFLKHFPRYFIHHMSCCYRSTTCYFLKTQKCFENYF